MGEPARADVEAISPDAWRLLRVAADFSQRDVEREIDGIMQAHISMLESGTRALSVDRRQQLLDLYVAELTPEQVDALVEHF
jgi:transcriptional regulator with XRE-family HTH domain